MVQPDDIKRWIETALPGSRARVTGDGQHFEAVVESSEFAGKSMVAQHQIVYGCLGDKMRAEIHALSIRTLTPGQAE